MNKKLVIAAKLLLGAVVLMLCGLAIGLLMLGLSVVAGAVPLGCSTDTECMVMFGGNGGPEPMMIEDPGCAGIDCTGIANPADGGFLLCPEPDVSKPAISPEGALIKFS